MFRKHTEGRLTKPLFYYMREREAAESSIALLMLYFCFLTALLLLYYYMREREAAESTTALLMLYLCCTTAVLPMLPYAAVC
jgi:predicted membrane-bound dolichyl-phosphate-mannose-protein mannosyltransferase